MEGWENDIRDFLESQKSTIFRFFLHIFFEL